MCAVRAASVLVREGLVWTESRVRRGVLCACLRQIRECCQLSWLLDFGSGTDWTLASTQTAFPNESKAVYASVFDGVYCEETHLKTGQAGANVNGVQHSANEHVDGARRAILVFVSRKYMSPTELNWKMSQPSCQMMAKLRVEM